MRQAKLRDRKLRDHSTAAFCMALFMALLFGPAAAVRAQQLLEEVVVTAGFRDRALIDAADSASVIGADRIGERHAEHIETILSAAPNVGYSSGASHARFVQVRGVGDLEQFVDPKHFPSVGIAVDGVDLGGTANAAMLFDARQVEILRGPQGTRFGTSALAGLVNVRSQRPSDEVEGYVQVGVADFQGRTVTAAVGGPLAERINGRLAFQRNRSDGFIRNRFLEREDSNGLDETSLRASFEFEGGSRGRYGLTLLNYDGDNGYDAFSLANDRETLSDEPGHDRQQTQAVVLRGEWRLTAQSSLEAATTWVKSDTDYAFDEDWSYVGICDGTLCDPVFDFFSNTDRYQRHRRDRTLDIRWLGDYKTLRGMDRQFVVGLYGQSRAEDLAREYYGPFTSAYDTGRTALYAEWREGLSERLALTLGLRYERFDDDYADSFALATSSADDLRSGEIAFSFRYSDRTRLYARLARGAKAGGVNTEASANQPFMQPQFRDFLAPRLRIDQEKLLNREIGLSGLYRDGRLAVRVALFAMTRDDAQLESWIYDGVNFLWVGFLDNAGGSNVGGEFEAEIRLSESWTLSAAIGVLDAEVDSIEVFDLDSAAFVIRDSIDQARAPGWQSNVALRWAGAGAWTAHVEVDARDGATFGYYHSGELSGHTLLNASLARRFGNTELSLWARNLTDQDVEIHGLYFGNDPRKGWVNEAYYQYGEPRLIGLSLRHSF